MKVTEYLYRGARPTCQADMMALRASGIDYILNLEHGYQAWWDGNSKEEETWAVAAGIEYLHIRMSDFFPPTGLQLYVALALIQKSVDYGHSIYVHCLHGVDRTGCVIAAYRVKVQKWSWDEAYKELLERGFHRFWYWWWLWSVKRFLKV